MKVLRYSAALGGIFLVLGATWIGKELSSPLSPQRGEEAALLYERETKTEEILPITLPHAELKPVSLFVVGDILLARDVSHVDYKSMDRLLTSLKRHGFRILKHYYAESHVPVLSVIEKALLGVIPLLRRRIAILASV